MGKLYRPLLRFTSVCLFAACIDLVQAGVERMRVLALFENKAILEIDGARRVLSKGQTSPEGVLLVEANTEQAVVAIDGKREVLRLGVVAGNFKGSGAASVTLYSTGNAFFAEGRINNTPVRFLVDTGATHVALSSVLAKQAGIDYLKGEPGVAKTASGFTRMYGVKLDRVKVGDIVLYNVEAGVTEGSQPDTPLLGMSFLNSLEMRRDGDRMELIKRY